MRVVSMHQTKCLVISYFRHHTFVWEHDDTWRRDSWGRGDYGKQTHQTTYNHLPPLPLTALALTHPLLVLVTLHRLLIAYNPPCTHTEGHGATPLSGGINK